MTTTFINVKGEDSSINATMDIFEKIDNVLISIVLKVPADEKDKNYQKEFYKTTVDLKKLFKGVEASFVSKVIMENFKDSVDFDLKFPFQKVG